MGKVEPCDYNAAKFQLLWNLIASLQPLEWIPMPIFNPMTVLPKPSSTPLKQIQRQLASIGKVDPCENNAAKI